MVLDSKYRTPHSILSLYVHIPTRHTQVCTIYIYTYIYTYYFLGVSKNRGIPKWMVKIMENPMNMDDLGGKPTILGNIQFLKLQYKSNEMGLQTASCFFGPKKCDWQSFPQMYIRNYIYILPNFTYPSQPLPPWIFDGTALIRLSLGVLGGDTQGQELLVLLNRLRNIHHVPSLQPLGIGLQLPGH